MQDRTVLDVRAAPDDDRPEVVALPSVESVSGNLAYTIPFTRQFVYSVRRVK